MRILAPLLCALACAVPAKADTYWFAEPPAASAENPVLDCIRGVLLSEDDDNYVLRVVGGEMTVAKKRVVRVDKDDFTVEAIAKMEADAAAALAKANDERLLTQDVERTRRNVLVADAAARRLVAVEPLAPVAQPPVAPFDPVVGVARVGPLKQQMVLAATMRVRQAVTSQEKTEALRLLRVTRRS
jgi:hypothetical protein